MEISPFSFEIFCSIVYCMPMQFLLHTQNKTVRYTHTNIQTATRQQSSTLSCLHFIHTELSISFTTNHPMQYKKAYKTVVAIITHFFCATAPPSQTCWFNLIHHYHHHQFFYSPSFNGIINQSITVRKTALLIPFIVSLAVLKADTIQC